MGDISAETCISSLASMDGENPEINVNIVER